MYGGGGEGMSTKKICSNECSIVRSLGTLATSEKEEIRVLNDRLGDMFVKLERARIDSSKPDNSAFLAAIAGLQEEVKKMRAAYEAELNNLRLELERANQEKNNALGAVAKCKKNCDQLNSQLQDCCNENARLRDEVAQLKSCMAHKDNEIAQLTSCLQSVQSELDLLRPKAAKFEHDAHEYREQLDRERRQRAELEDKVKQLQEKAVFDARMHEQHVRDLNERIAKLQSIIDGLNEKLRVTIAEHNKAIANPNIVLNKMRESMARELADYKRDAEEAMRKALGAMKERLEQSERDRDAATAEQDRLRELVCKLQGQINELEGQLGAATQSNQQLQVALQNQKLAHTRAIRDLEKKLHDLQECIMEKVREVASVREVQASLRAEIESYKAILDDGEHRLSSTTLPPLHGVGLTSTKAGGGGGFSVSHSYSGYSKSGGGGQGVNRLTLSPPQGGLTGSRTPMCHGHCSTRGAEQKMGGMHHC